MKHKLDLILLDYPIYCLDFENRGGRVFIDLDGANGVDVNTISSITRQLNAFIEEENLTEVVSLEVGTAGIGNNFKSDRQYSTNVGRDVQVTLDNGSTFSGLLVMSDSKRVVIKTDKMYRQFDKMSIGKSKVIIG